MHILHVVGARPNFMKAAPVYAAFAALPAVRQTLLHTGQHYDNAMSGVFFEQLGLPRPDVNLEVGSGTHAKQTAAIMERFEGALDQARPDWVVVYGDVNSTVACALVCSKLGVKVAHVEAGLRSFDRSMPEEINRLLTDQLADLLFTPSTDGDENLRREGIDPRKVHFVGNVMIDTLIRLLPYVQKLDHPFASAPYILVTLHRAANVDDLGWLKSLLESLARLAEDINIVFPVHPRTRARIREMGDKGVSSPRLHLADPAPYLEFLNLQRMAKVVVTDSGGVQEETTYLQVPCLTVRENTERPITISMGTNQLVGRDVGRLEAEVRKVLRGEGVRSGSVPPLWDGKAAVRIADIMVRHRE